MLTLYRNIKKYRNENGWTQSDLASRMGYSDKSMISKIEAGKIDLSQSQIIKFAQLFGVAPGVLFGEDGTTNYDVSPFEYKIIRAYRKAEDWKQKSICDQLGLLKEDRETNSGSSKDRRVI